jgi:hypothetical protein
MRLHLATMAPAPQHYLCGLYTAEFILTSLPVFLNYATVCLLLGCGP